jgi:HEPN superfamily AbiU2-like protein
MAKTVFERELEIFRTEEEVAQQYFFAYLSVRSMAAADREVLQIMNVNPLFWITAHHAMLLSAFVALGRIFDQKSRHNIDALMNAASKDVGSFSKSALAARKQANGLSRAEAAAYVADAHELSARDLRALRKEIAAWRRVYEDRYRDTRDRVFAHKGLSDVGEVDALLKRTKIDELKCLFAFLSALYLTLWETFYNGRKPHIEPTRFELPPRPVMRGREVLPGETVYREGHAVLKSMLAVKSEHQS